MWTQSEPASGNGTGGKKERPAKSGLEVRPVFHWTEEQGRSHVLVCFLALVLESALQRRLLERAPELSYPR